MLVLVSSAAVKTRRTGTRTKAYEAHHIFPRALQDDFKDGGIWNVHYPFFLCWQRYQQHQDAKDAYNTAWRGVLNRIKDGHSDGQLHVTDRGTLIRRGLEFASGRRTSG